MIAVRTFYVRPLYVRQDMRPRGVGQERGEVWWLVAASVADAGRLRNQTKCTHPDVILHEDFVTNPWVVNPYLQYLLEVP